MPGRFRSFSNLSHFQVNSPESFQIRGSIGRLLKGHHQVYFEPGKATWGGTKVVLHEDFTGPLSFVVRRGSGMRRDLDLTFRTFNENLKRRVEGTAS